MSNLKGTNIAAPILPFSTEDIFETHWAQYGKGGYRTVLNLTDRNNIEASRREDLMLVAVIDNTYFGIGGTGGESAIYQLKLNNHTNPLSDGNLINNDNWIPFEIGGGDDWVFPAPISSSASGERGQRSFDEDFLYICIEDNTWKRIAMDFFVWNDTTAGTAGFTLTNGMVPYWDGDTDEWSNAVVLKNVESISTYGTDGTNFISGLNFIFTDNTELLIDNIIGGGGDDTDIWVQPPPPTSISPGTAGQKSYSATHLYICVEDNVWRRINLDYFDSFNTTSGFLYSHPFGSVPTWTGNEWTYESHVSEIIPVPSAGGTTLDVIMTDGSTSSVFISGSDYTTAGLGYSNVDKLSDLSDVNDSSKSLNDVISYDGTDWVSINVNDIIVNPTLSEISDTDIISPTINQVIGYDGSRWVNIDNELPDHNTAGYAFETDLNSLETSFNNSTAFILSEINRLDFDKIDYYNDYTTAGLLNENELTVAIGGTNSLNQSYFLATGFISTEGTLPIIPSSGTNTQFDVPKGVVQFVTPSTGEVEIIEYGPYYNIEAQFLSEIASYVLIDKDKNIIQRLEKIKPEETHELIQLGVIDSRFGYIFKTHAYIRNTAYNFATSVRQFMNIFPSRSIEGHDVYGSTSGDLSFTIESGKIWNIGENWEIDKNNTDILTTPDFNPATDIKLFSRAGITGNSDYLDPTLWDNNGVLEAVPSGYTSIQPLIILDDDILSSSYGQKIFDNFESALGSVQMYINSHEFTLDTGLILGVWVLQEDVTDTNDNTKAVFVKVSSDFAGASSIAVSLQEAYNNSVIPQIITSSEKGSFVIKNGDVEGSKVFGIYDSTSGEVMSIDSYGNIITEGITVGDVIYSGSDGSSGEVLHTDGSGNTYFDKNKTNTITLSYSLTENINNISKYFYSWSANKSNVDIRSGNLSGMSSSDSCSPIILPVDGTIVKCVLKVKGVGVDGTPIYPVLFQTEIYDVGFSSEGSKIADLNFPIIANVGDGSVGNTNDTVILNTNIDVTVGQALGLKFVNGLNESFASYSLMAFVTLYIEEK